MRRIAVDTSQVAGGQPDEHAGKARERAFSLKAAIDFMDEQASGRLLLERLEAVAISRAGGEASGSPGSADGTATVKDAFLRSCSKNPENMAAPMKVVHEGLDSSYGPKAGSPRAVRESVAAHSRATTFSMTSPSTASRNCPDCSSVKVASRFIRSLMLIFLLNACSSI